MKQKQPSHEYISNLLADCGQQARAAASLPMTQTHKINAQAAAKPSPALRAAWRIMKARGLEMFAHEANELAAIIEDEIKTDPRCVAFDKAGRALGVDASKLAESIDLVALIDNHFALTHELLRETGIYSPENWSQEMTKAHAILAKLEALKPAHETT